MVRAAAPRMDTSRCLAPGRVWSRRAPNGRVYTGLVPSKDEVIETLRQVEDPELGMDIVDLGLLYDVDVADSTVRITYSLTSMGCPAGPLIAQDIDRAAREVPGVEQVDLELTFDPPWTPDRMSDDAKFILGFG
jgi:metal-sulfur cluster biosynthetic enzyme